MKKIIIAPDSFKGSLSAVKICSIIENVIKKHYDDIQIIKIPIADGGEGTVECFLQAMGGTKINLPVKGPYFKNINSFYAVMPDGNTAVIEMASAAGLPLVKNKKNPALTTTYGVGQLIAHALNKGCRKIILGLGGSSTNDGGVGMAAALGIKFYNKDNKEFIPTGNTLNKISRIDMSEKLKELDKCNIKVMCDVNNPLYGKNGASYVYAPQKGADEKMVKMLDQNLQHLSQIIHHDIGIDVSMIPGAGAAGGMGAGVLAFLNAKLKMGIDIVLDTFNLDFLLNKADCILTGEGKIDSQSLSGKAIIGVARRAKLKKVPVIAIVGDISDDIDIESIYKEGITVIMSINRNIIPLKKAIIKSEENMALTIDTLMRIIKFINK